MPSKRHITVYLPALWFRPQCPLRALLSDEGRCAFLEALLADQTAQAHAAIPQAEVVVRKGEEEAPEGLGRDVLPAAERAGRGDELWLSGGPGLVAAAVLRRAWEETPGGTELEYRDGAGRAALRVAKGVSAGASTDVHSPETDGPALPRAPETLERFSCETPIDLLALVADPVLRALAPRALGVLEQFIASVARLEQTPGTDGEGTSNGFPGEASLMESGGALWSFRPTERYLRARLRFLPLASLKNNSEVYAHTLAEVRASFDRIGYLKHPIVCDRGTGCILDGQHRTAALRNSGCRWALCQPVDYLAEHVRVENWHRTVAGPAGWDGLLEILDGMLPRWAVELGITPPQVEPRSVRFSRGMGDARGDFALLRRLENRLLAEGFRVEVHAPEDAAARLGRVGALTVIRPPYAVPKERVLEAAEQGRPYAANCNRNVIPGRILGANVPLAALAAPDGESGAAEGGYEALLGRRLLYLPGGVWYDGRRYEEDVLVFGAV